VAIARALVARPHVLFADEPTGALDLRNAQEILLLLLESVDDLGQTVVMVTHDPVAVSHADTVLFLVDGWIVASMEHPSPAQGADYALGVESSL
jgi:putative ABC transport system ATP-binding protein